MVYNYTIPRRPIMAMFTGPGPCYGLPGIIGRAAPHDPRSVHVKAPDVPFAGKGAKFTDQCGPGAGKYYPGDKMYNTGREHRISHQCVDRRPVPPGPRTPGPSDYSPDELRCSSGHARAPAYSCRIRTQHEKRDVTPGPSNYDHEPMIGRTIRSGRPTAPMYHMVFKSGLGGFEEDLAKTPGPAAYKKTDLETYMRRSAAYTMVGKGFIPRKFRIPGPGAHSPEKTDLQVRKRVQPAYTFGLRHSQYCSPVIIDPVL